MKGALFSTIKLTRRRFQMGHKDQGKNLNLPLIGRMLTRSLSLRPRSWRRVLQLRRVMHLVDLPALLLRRRALRRGGGRRAGLRTGGVPTAGHGAV